MKSLINITVKLKFFFGWVENIVGKGENADYQHFLLFPTMFSKSFSGSLKVGIVWYRIDLRASDLDIYRPRGMCYSKRTFYQNLVEEQLRCSLPDADKSVRFADGIR